MIPKQTNNPVRSAWLLQPELVSFGDFWIRSDRRLFWLSAGQCTPLVRRSVGSESQRLYHTEIEVYFLRRKTGSLPWLQVYPGGFLYQSDVKTDYSPELPHPVYPPFRSDIAGHIPQHLLLFFSFREMHGSSEPRYQSVFFEKKPGLTSPQPLAGQFPFQSGNPVYYLADNPVPKFLLCVLHMDARYGDDSGGETVETRNVLNISDFRCSHLDGNRPPKEQAALTGGLFF